MGENWKDCILRGNPNKNGLYLLQVGVRGRRSTTTQIGVIKAKWDGKKWHMPPYYIPMRWTENLENADKYGDFSDILHRGNNKCLE